MVNQYSPCSGGDINSNDLHRRVVRNDISMRSECDQLVLLCIIANELRVALHRIDRTEATSSSTDSALCRVVS